MAKQKKPAAPPAPERIEHRPAGAFVDGKPVAEPAPKASTKTASTEAQKQVKSDG